MRTVRGTPGRPQTWSLPSAYLSTSAFLLESRWHDHTLELEGTLAITEPNLLWSQVKKPSQQSYPSCFPKVAQWVTGNKSQASRLASHAVIFYLPQPPLQGSGLFPSPPVDFLRAPHTYRAPLDNHPRNCFKLSNWHSNPVNI